MSPGRTALGGQIAAEVCASRKKFSVLQKAEAAHKVSRHRVRRDIVLATPMFRPHSLLWHYLWVAPNLLSGVLAIILWRQGLHKQHRSFFVYACFQCAQWLVLYPIDLIPSVPSADYWRAYALIALIEFLVTFALISDIFADVFGGYPVLARLGKLLIRWGGALLLIAATAVAAYAPVENQHLVIHASHVAEEAMYVVVSGLILLLFMSAAYFRLNWGHSVFGVALGLGIYTCVHLATWAALANAGLTDSVRSILDFVNLATTHIAVLIWYYYLLVPQKAVVKSAVPLPDSNLAVWNRELERLLQQ